MSRFGAGAILLVGAGQMGGALLKGWIAEGLERDRVFIQDPAMSSEMAAFCQQHGIAPASASPDMPSPPALILLAVKPQMMDDVLPSVEPSVGKDSVVLSVAAGRTLASIAKHFEAGTPIVRAMPNTPSAIGRGISALYGNEAVTPDQVKLCDALMAAVGETVWLDDEAQMDAVTAVSGSGPAYVFLLAECLADAGIAAGLKSELAHQLARATVSGAGELLRRSSETSAQLRRNVTSPGGTTEAAIRVLTNADKENAESPMHDLFRHAVLAAAKRGKDLAG